MLQTSEEAIRLINSVSLALPQKKALQLNPRWSPVHAEMAAKSYRQFLYLAWVYGARTPLVPHLSVDEIWHQHILCTQAYTTLCEALLGRYYHHNPGGDAVPSAEDARLYRQTCALLVHHFGPEAHPEKVFSVFYPQETPTAAA